MKKRFNLLWLLVLLASCGPSLKSVNQYSAASVAGLQKFEELGYSFTQHKLESCHLDNIAEAVVKIDTTCDCSLYSKADEATETIYNHVLSYLSGLQKLSNPANSSYDISPINKALNEGKFANISIEKTQVDAAGKLATLLMNAIGGAYAKKRLKQYIAEANPALQILVEKLQFILKQNLAGLLAGKKIRLYGYYGLLAKSNELNQFEKGLATETFYQKINTITIQQQKINAFANGLSAIVKGHQKLYDNREKLDLKELQTAVAGYVSEIRAAITTFNKSKIDK